MLTLRDFLLVLAIVVAVVWLAKRIERGCGCRGDKRPNGGGPRVELGPGARRKGFC